MDIQTYLDQLRAQYASGHATEHSYRPALRDLFQGIDGTLTVVNEPKKSEAGMPDFLFQRGGIPLGWAEAKDIDKDVIRLKGYSIEQRKRYEKAYPNLIYTNGVDFEFIREGAPVHFVSIASFLGPLGGLQPLPDKFEELERQLRLFAQARPISIRSASKLAQMMAAKAAIIKDEIGIALADDPESRSALGGQFKSFKANLLPALTPDEFADIYAETITYGMFAARFHDDTLDTFSRQEALEKLPASNPFLKGLFRYIAGTELPRRLEYIVDDLVQLMRASDPHSLFRDFGKFTARNDPFVHFYEDFLAAYNPKKRKSRGVWYTPEPVVDFIVRAVDDVLKTEFGLADGLADTSKVTVDWDTGQSDRKGKPVTIRKDVHKVQILDPATGTGTFLAKTVQLIADRVKARAPGKWSGYVEQDLLPRLHGFELLMASYAMCHMKLDMMLAETGYRPSAKPPRLSVWLTNALEPADRDVSELFFQPLADEARGASEVKRQSPIMCVIGNPPYSVVSSNRSAAAESLVEPYKAGLNERNIQPLSDDYVKFIAKAEAIIAENGQGVVGFISNNSYLDGRIHRKMREHLLNTFDSLHILNLHGSTMRQEMAPDGSKDENVFEILPGVSIIVAVKRASRSGSQGVFYADLWGKRAVKNEALYARSLLDLGPLEKDTSRYKFFVPKDFTGVARYKAGFALDELFRKYVCGVVTARDGVLVNASAAGTEQLLSTLSNESLQRVQEKYPALTDTSEWQLALAMSDATRASIRRYCYRPFDVRYIPYSATAKGILSRPRGDVLGDFDGNLALLSTKHLSTFGYQHALVTDLLSDKCTTSSQTREASFHFPLYASASEGLLELSGRTLNLEPTLSAAICKAAGIDPADQAGPDDDFRAATGEARPSEVKVFDYLYGVLYSPAYREKFAEFLKIDFPRIPYPPSPEIFAHVGEKGEQLRRLHLMEPAAIGDASYPYHGEGDDAVAAGFPKWAATPPSVRPEPVEGLASTSAGVSAEQGSASTSSARTGKVLINQHQYFADVPAIAWSFHIGGY